MKQICSYPPYTLNLTDCEFLLIFHLLHEIQECLEGMRHPCVRVTAQCELAFDIEYGILETYLQLLKKIDIEIMRDMKEAG